MRKLLIWGALLALVAVAFFSYSTSKMENSEAPEESPADLPAASDEKAR
ncbi:hypothetical protein [uncultured Hyphomicrobium sp.]|nr:hypothetical protein [uncultured Hyphomicrobium sp.]